MIRSTVKKYCLLSIFSLHLLSSSVIGQDNSWFHAIPPIKSLIESYMIRKFPVAMAKANGGQTCEYLSYGPKFFEAMRQTKTHFSHTMFTISGNLILGHYGKGINVLTEDSWNLRSIINKDIPSYVVHAVSGNIVFLSAAQSISAWNITTGNKMWTFTFSHLKDQSFIAAPIIYGDKIFCYRSKHIFALNIKNGSPTWTYKSHKETWEHSFAIANGVLCFPQNNHIKALSADTGKVKWILR